MAASGARTGRFRRSDRLLDARDFRRVMRQGRRLSSREVVVISAARVDSRPSLERSGSRLGITASRKVGNAVVRNRFKRRVREWFRRRRAELDRDLDVVVIARRAGAGLGAAELDDRLSGLLGIRPAGDESASKRRLEEH